MKISLTLALLLIGCSLFAQPTVILKRDTLIIAKVGPGTFIQVAERIYGIDKDSILYELAPRLRVVKNDLVFPSQWKDDTIWQCKVTIMHKL